MSDQTEVDIRVHNRIVEASAKDDRGNPYLTYWIGGKNEVGIKVLALTFDAAMRKAGVRELFLRTYDLKPHTLRVRFTAYDTQGNCITEMVCGNADLLAGE